MATNRFMMKSMLQLCLFPSLISPFIALKALYLPVYPTHICLKIFAGKYSHSEQKINKNTAPKKSGTTLTEAHQRKLINLLYCTTIMAELHRKTQFAVG